MEYQFILRGNHSQQSNKIIRTKPIKEIRDDVDA